MVERPKPQERKITGGPLQSVAQTQKENDLEAEAERIKKSIQEGTLRENESSPADEAELEARGIETDPARMGPTQPLRDNPRPQIVAPNGTPLNADAIEKQAEILRLQAQKLREAERVKAEANQPGMRLIDITDNAYREFIRRGHPPQIALYLLQAFANLDASVSLGAIASALQAMQPKRGRPSKPTA